MDFAQPSAGSSTVLKFPGDTVQQFLECGCDRRLPVGVHHVNEGLVVLVLAHAFHFLFSLYYVFSFSTVK